MQASIAVAVVKDHCFNASCLTDRRKSDAEGIDELSE